MTLIDTLKNWLSTSKNEIPEGYCPNCWGFQEYSGNFYEAVLNKGITINNLEENKGWIQNYADQYLNNIKIKNTHESENVVCEKCKIKYTQV